MNPFTWLGADREGNFQVLWEDGDRVFCRAWRRGPDGDRDVVLAVLPAAEHPTPLSLDRLAHEYKLKDELDRAWAVRPLELIREGGQTMLVLEDPGGEPLERLLGTPMEVGDFLHLAIAIATALTQVHRRGLIHKDIKPANILVNRTDRRVRLTGFGISSRLPRERQPPEPPESIAGTLAYMAPEQTGRMNRSIDTRSDLYSLGGTFYQMLTGRPPFTASDPMEWVHCHIARRPVAPSERLENIPAPISDVVMKLLAKTAEERYQTAAGLERDLRRCLAEWERRGRIEPFALGEHDAPDRLLIPERLYGRAREVETLLAAFDRVVGEGGPELVLVSGYSGIGKSSVVHELNRALVPSRGLFAAGKFDQYKRDIPYATLAQALQSLIRPLLGKSDDELAPWRDALGEALGANGQLMVPLIPELEPLIGSQPPVAEVPPQDAQRRFQLVFRRLLGVFARPEHPLVLFLDDLQWLDVATLDLVEHLTTQSELRHLLLVGAYRDNEVAPSHPLMRRLAAIRDAGGRLQEIVLAPLRLEDVGRLIADALQCAPDRAEPLSQLVHEKTGGNPFFTIQFLTALAEQGLIAVDHGAARWTWDLEHIHAKDYTDNVVNLMLGKLRRLPAETQKAMQQLACLGNTAPISTLAMVRGGSEEALHAELWTAICAGLVSRQEGTYQFLHDRVQEAAYALTPKEERVAQHLGIGRLLAAHTEPEKQEEAIFEIVNQLNRGTALITSRDEREQLAELNLLAGKRAKASSAYDSALKYLIAATALLADDRWERRRDLAFPLELQRAECEFLTGELAAADERLTTLSSCTANTVERATVACLRIDVCTTLDQSDRAIAVALDYLRHGDIHWSPHPTAEEARREYEQIWSRLGSHTIEDLIDLPLMNDPEALATVDVLTKVLPPALFTNANLVSLTICRAVNLSLELGNCDASCFAYVMLGRIAGARFGDYKAGFRFGQLGYDLVERRGLKRFHASTYLIFAIVTTWMKHVRFSCDLLRQAFEAANRSGDLTYAAYACNNLNSALLFKGDPLAEVHREAEHGLAFAQRAGFGLVTDIITTQIALVRTLRGLTPEFGCLDGEHLEEFRFEQHLSDNPVRAIAEFRYWIRKLEARYLAGRYVAAVQASLRAQRLLWTGALSFEEAEYHFYDALLRAACCEGASASERQQHLQSLVAHHRRLAVWADNCPENFENRVALVAAEIARVEGRDFEAMRFYEQAVRSARSNGFIHCEALASELAARFYMARDFDKIAHTYLRTARDCYLQWGADGKVRQLEQLHPYLREEKSLPEPTSTIVAPVEHLDLATVIKVSQAVSSEVILETLIDKLMRVAMEHAGAERGLLILSRGAEPRIVAKAKIDGDTVAVDLCDDPVTAAVLPEAILHHVLRARESIILDDAAAQNPFSADSYIHQREARSIFCLPLIAQAKLVGALYLENNLTARVFASARIAVLKLLASQAAIALENARLYRDLAEREAKIRRLVDANLIGIFIWGLQGQIIEANDTFLRMVGYDHEDLAAGRVRWTDLAPPQWLGSTAGAPEEIDTRGAAQAYEKEYLRKDGSRVPVLIGSTAFDEARDEGVTFVLDLTERKRAEAAAREVQLELAHANRVATMGQLSASIAHEINQPIGAAITYAQAGLSWLRAKPPNLEEALHALNLIVESSVRTAEVIDRIRALFKKAPTRNERLDINDGIREVIELTRGEAVKHDVSVQTDLADSLPLIYGDRVQLQQVILNLIMNAVEAMSGASDGKRELLISTRKADLQGVLVGVRDSGPGLAPEALERLFDAFYTTKPGGLGLGLSICRSIIEAHGGRLWANANVPHGAIFEFTVPAYPDITS